MSDILLDTSAYSAFLRAHSGVQSVVRRAPRIALTPIVLGELRSGFLKGNRLARNRAELERFLASPRVDVLDIDEGTSERYAVILDSLRTAGTPIPTNDIWIAASAFQYGLTLVTTDRHFRKVCQILVDIH